MVSISEEYRVIKYIDSSDNVYYYKFMGFTTGPSDPIMPENANLTYSYTTLPSGTLIANYIRIQPIEINAYSGGSYSASVSNNKVETSTIFQNIVPSSKIEVVDSYSSFENTNPAGSQASVTKLNVNTGINFVYYNSEVIITPHAASGYTVKEEGALFKNENESYNASYTPISINGYQYDEDGNPIEMVAGMLDLYGSKIPKYNQTYSFKYEFTNAFVITVKQYEMTSLSSSALAKLYTTFALASLRQVQLDQVYFESATALDDYGQNATGLFDYTYGFNNYMKTSLPQGADFYLYFFADSTVSLSGIYVNGELAATVDDGTLIKETYQFEGKDIYRVNYKSLDGCDDGVASDLSIEVRFSTSIQVQTIISGLDKISGEYPYDEIFDPEMYDGPSIILAQHASAEGSDITHFLTGNTTNQSNITEIMAGSSIQYLLKTTTTTQYSFVGYFFYKIFPAEKDAGGGGWFSFSYNERRYYYNTNTQKVYEGNTLASNIADFNVSFKQKELADGTKEYTISMEEVISYNKEANISISSIMVDNMVDGVVQIHAKFAQVVTFTFIKEIDEYAHIDDKKFANDYPDTFLSYFDAWIEYENANGNLQQTAIGGNLSTTITIAKMSEVIVYPYISPSVANEEDAVFGDDAGAGLHQPW